MKLIIILCLLLLNIPFSYSKENNIKKNSRIIFFTNLNKGIQKFSNDNGLNWTDLENEIINKNVYFTDTKKNKYFSTDNGLNWTLIKNNQNEKIAANSITIYPNPIINQVTVSSYSEIKSILIVNFIGKKLIEGLDYKISYYYNNVEIELLIPSGIYFLKVNDFYLEKIIVSSYNK